MALKRHCQAVQCRCNHGCGGCTTNRNIIPLSNCPLSEVVLSAVPVLQPFGRTKRASLSVRSFVRSFVSLSIVSVRGVHPMGERTAVLHRNLRGDNILGSTNKYTKFGKLITRKSLKLRATRCHTAPNSTPGVCPFVSSSARLSVRLSDRV